LLTVFPTSIEEEELEMKLLESQWHVQVYLWCRETWNTFRDDNDWGLRPNLCLYIRSITVWAPLALFCQITLFDWAGYVLVYYPVTRIGWTGFLWEVGVVTTIAIAIILFRLIRRYIRRLDHIWTRRRSRKLEKLEGTREDAEEVLTKSKRDKGPSFIEVIYNYLVAAKEKTCPSIEIVPNKE
jgi:hypothetical protein